MEFQKRVDDISKIVDNQWKANHNYKKINQVKEQTRQHFNKMYNIKDKRERDREILEANSIEGRLKRLEGNMQAAKGNDLFRNRNNFR